MRRTMWILATAMLIATAATADKSSTESKAQTRQGPAATEGPRTRTALTGSVFVGEKAPDFELAGSPDQQVRLSRLREDWILLAFGDRKEQVGKLHAAQAEIAPLGVKIIAVCHERPGSVRSYVRRDSIPFVMLGDLTGEISSIYGLYDRKHSETRPGYLVLDRQRVVKMALFGQDLPPSDVVRLVSYAVSGQ